MFLLSLLSPALTLALDLEGQTRSGAATRYFRGLQRPRLQHTGPMSRLLPLAAATLLTAAALFAGPAPVSLQPCKPEGAAEEVLCGTVDVFENRGARRGRVIPLNVVVLPALDAAGKKEPLFELDGGPGVAATNAVGPFTTELREYRVHRDIVLVDQRGTGKSNPLVCSFDGSPFRRGLGEMYPPSYVRQCRSDARGHADLRFYSTPIAADDLDDVRAALGYDRINIEAVSYGTRLALVYAKRHREHVKSMVLIGALPTWGRLPLYHSAFAQRAIDLVFDDCESNPSCRGGHPDVRARWRALLASLRARPVTVRNGQESALLSADVFAELVRKMLYLPATSRGIPALIDATSRGNYKALINQLAQSSPTIADGAYLSITCSEDMSRIDPDEARRVTAGTDFGDYRIRQQRRACSDWPSTSLPSNFWDDVVTDAPVLIFSGYRDPVTPPVWSYAIASHLPSSWVVSVPHDAHLPIGLENVGCWDKIENAFLDRASLANEDLTCVNQMRPPPFAK
jgi:pimeloyl-ACP methyl ester carboxylesterase